MKTVGPCPKCMSGILVDSGTDSAGSDVSCLQCGYVQLSPEDRARLDAGALADRIPDDRQRRRRPSHGKIRL